ncbi:MAG: M15 family metallopeptidase [Bacteroidales bacterium]
MRALQRGYQGRDVKKWQFFLIGQGFTCKVADGVFGQITREATQRFQRRWELMDDGMVGTLTYARAGLQGFELVKNPADDNPEGLHWPPEAPFRALAPSSLRKKLGAFSYQLKPEPNPRHEIAITCNWEQENLVEIEVPLFSPLPPAHTRSLKVHKKVVRQFERLFAQWHQAGISDRLLSFDEGFSARMEAGSRTRVSAHSFGIAFDVNASFNPLGQLPPKTGAQGSVRELVEIAHQNGFCWGGHSTPRAGMHFEVAHFL